MKMRRLLRRLNLIILPILLASTGVIAAGKAPLVGRKAAEKYLSRNPSAVEVSDSDTSSEEGESSRRRSRSGGGRGGGDDLLMLSLGTFVNSSSYNWKGSDKRDNVGRVSYGVTYLFDEWSKIDANLRLDFAEYKLDDLRASKLSIMPLWTFPQASSRFPLYFGFGAGLGVFFNQVPEESNLSFDYQLLAGARFMDLFENFGFFVELALKNHLHLLSDGQFNGSALTAGAVFSF